MKLTLCVCVSHELKKNTKYQGTFQVISTVSGNLFQSYCMCVCVCVSVILYECVCVFAHWMEMSNVFLAVAHGQKSFINAIISVSPSMDADTEPPVPDAHRVCLNAPQAASATLPQAH